MLVTSGALHYTVITQDVNEVQDTRNAPAVSMAQFLIERDRMGLLPSLSIYSERGTERKAVRLLYMNAAALEIWREMGMHPTVVGAQTRPSRTAELTFGVPYSE